MLFFPFGAHLLHYPFQLSARNLYPYEWSIFTSFSYPITPLFTSSMALIYSPINGHPVFVSPTFTYSLAQNLEVDFVSQLVLQDIGNGYGSDTQVFYLRVKWSY